MVVGNSQTTEFVAPKYSLKNEPDSTGGGVKGDLNREGGGSDRLLERLQNGSVRQKDKKNKNKREHASRRLAASLSVRAAGPEIPSAMEPSNEGDKYCRPGVQTLARSCWI